ncbi:hypothetical protein ATE84_4387 [Aquimarina sp. MAR_2010_214]|uniref:hypothetical protein n=1 Tax=Aquimarina sp. MAR_2010_214 TaxID=1250026 RepID=UPI000C7119FA|nr:hypothetical protein [Aquimarina sp. MAR_2010_214]PKV52277.1 hypothetical protein ATE84_4387 [Aquimarina sp. MAR_2010_214]
MKYIYRSVTVLCVLVLFFSGKKYQKKSSMDIARGLKSAIVEYTNLEQKLIIKVAKKLENNGFPVDDLTRVHLKKRILNDKDYYAENEITFFVNPAVYKEGEFNWGIETITIDWEDTSVMRTPDGGIEFMVGNKTKPEDLVMNLYGMNDSYSYHPLLKDHDNITKEINNTLLINDLEEIKYFTSQGITGLIRNYLIVLAAYNENENLYEMVIKRIDRDLVDTKYFNKLFKQYRLKIDTNTSRIEVLNSFDPTFFPSPAANPVPPVKNKF